MNVLDRLRRVCLAFPGAYEKVAWSARVPPPPARS